MECLTTTGGLCSTEADECTCGGAGGEADPYFSGFTGQQFYFPAEAGNVYNLLSEKVSILLFIYLSSTPQHHLVLAISHCISLQTTVQQS